MNDWANLITAIATAITATLIYIDMRTKRMNAAPQLQLMSITDLTDGWHAVTMRVHPGESHHHFAKLKASHAQVEAVTRDYDPAYGSVNFNRSHGLVSSSLVIDVSVGAKLIGATVVDMHFCVKAKSDKRIRISLSTALTSFVTWRSVYTDIRISK